MNSITYLDKIQPDLRSYRDHLSKQELELLGEIINDIKFERYE